jgi:hypothetical protein
MPAMERALLLLIVSPFINFVMHLLFHRRTAVLGVPEVYVGSDGSLMELLDRTGVVAQWGFWCVFGTLHQLP